MLIPCDHKRLDNRLAYAHVIYSDDHGHTCCLYECGDKDYWERITLARGTLEWLTNGQEQ